MVKAFIHLGAGINSILPLRDYLKKKKYKPILIDRNPINSIDPWLISEQLPLNMDKDIYAYVEKMSKKFDILGAYPVADYANDVAAEINKRYNPLLGNDKSIRILRDKYKVNEIILGSGLKIPEPYISNTKNSYNRKFIVKPRYGNDSIGVHITDTQNPCLIEQARDKNLIIQSKISGTLYNIDAVICKGNVYILSINMRMPLRENELITRFTIQTNSIQSFISEPLEGYVSKVVDTLNYSNGPITIDCIIDKYGVVTFLEASPFLHKPWLNKMGSSVSPFIKIADLYDSIKYNTDFVFNCYPSYVSFEYINYTNTAEELQSIKYLSSIANEVYIDSAWSNYQNSNARIKSIILGKVDMENLHMLLQAYDKLG